MKYEDLNILWSDYRPQGLSDAEVIAWALTEVAVSLKECANEIRKCVLALDPK